LRADTKDLDDSDEYVCESSSTSMEGAGASLTCADEDGSISQLRGLLTAHWEGLLIWTVSGLHSTCAVGKPSV
jgi:hypothetical protein